MTESSESATSSSSPGAGDFNTKIVEEYRANGGKLGGMFSGSDLLLLHHTGVKSGTERISPLAYQMVGESYAVFASRAGSPC